MHSASLVCKAWLAATREPSFWHTLSRASGLSEKSKSVGNLTGMLELLSRHQFSSLKSLTLFFKFQTRQKSLSLIAEACPVLEGIDMGLANWSRMGVTDAVILDVPVLFPCLSRIQFSVTEMTNAGLLAFCNRIGGRLLLLCVRSTSHSNWISEDILRMVAQNCPNLRRIEVYSLQSRISAEEILAPWNDGDKLDGFRFAGFVVTHVDKVCLLLCWERVIP